MVNRRLKHGAVRRNQRGVCAHVWCCGCVHDSATCCALSLSNVSALSENSGKQMPVRVLVTTTVTAVRFCVSVKTVRNVGKDRQSRVIGRSFTGNARG